MTAIIIGANESVNTAVEEQLTENFDIRVHALKPDNVLNDDDQNVLENAHLVVIDLTSGIKSSRIFVKQICEISPQAGIILLHIYRERELIDPLFQAGAAGYVLVDTINNQLPFVARKVLNGEKAVSGDTD